MTYDFAPKSPIWNPDAHVDWHTGRLARFNSNCAYATNRCKRIDAALMALFISVYAVSIPVLFLKHPPPVGVTAISIVMLIAGVGIAYESTKFYRLWSREEPVYSQTI